MTTDIKSGFCGWDIGGAHLKVAYADCHGQLQEVIQLPCQLWLGVNHLKDTMQQALEKLNITHAQHAVTMTGELVDAFDNRQQGVAAIIDCVAEILADDNFSVFAGVEGWLNKNDAKLNWQAVASMNWQASAIHAAKHYEQALFIDIGSTTCDIIPIKNHLLASLGVDDHQRQTHGELVYTGAIRTPLFAITDHAFLNGCRVPLAAEWFASSGDVWCLMNEISGSEIQDISADGHPWSPEHCQQRLARVLATDAEMASSTQWQLIAAWFAEKQIQRIISACNQVLSGHTDITLTAPVIGAGVGRFIVKACAQRMNRHYIDFAELCQAHESAAAHAPAAALALLAQQELT
jgi:probable H4MPT-linked C1 transfer pathway protein